MSDEKNIIRLTLICGICDANELIYETYLWNRCTDTGKKLMVTKGETRTEQEVN